MGLTRLVTKKMTIYNDIHDLADKVDVLTPQQVKAELIRIANRILAENVNLAKADHVEVENPKEEDVQRFF